MPSSLKRIAYFGQTASLKADGGEYTLPVQSANVEVTRPIEAVTAFGKFNSLNTAQTNITTCKSTLKVYLGRVTNGKGLSYDILNDLIDTTQKSNITIKVDPAGFEMVGILTNIGIDISMGGFAMADLGFAGVGVPTITDANTAAVTVTQPTLTMEPITTMSIGQDGALANVFATSIKFSYDLPTDTLGVLGENPNANQASMKSIIATKAPYKSSISVEGYGVNISNDLIDTAVRGIHTIGEIGIKLPNAKVSARSLNNAAGQVSATFSYTIEDVGAEFSLGSLSPYTQRFDQINLPMYGSDLPS